MSSREHEYQMRECVIMYSPGMLEVRGLWLTRLELDRGGRGKRGSSPAEMKQTETPPPLHPQLQLVPPWTLSPYLTLSIKPTFSLSVSLSHPLWCAPVVEPLRKSPSTCEWERRIGGLNITVLAVAETIWKWIMLFESLEPLMSSPLFLPHSIC